jgi:hypothetical protein
MSLASGQSYLGDFHHLGGSLVGIKVLQDGEIVSETQLVGAKPQQHIVRLGLIGEGGPPPAQLQEVRVTSI